MIKSHDLEFLFFVRASNLVVYGYGIFVIFWHQLEWVVNVKILELLPKNKKNTTINTCSKSKCILIGDKINTAPYFGLDNPQGL